MPVTGTVLHFLKMSVLCNCGFEQGWAWLIILNLFSDNSFFHIVLHVSYAYYVLFCFICFGFIKCVHLQFICKVHEVIMCMHLFTVLVILNFIMATFIMFACDHTIYVVFIQCTGWSQKQTVRLVMWLVKAAIWLKLKTLRVSSPFNGGCQILIWTNLNAKQPRGQSCYRILAVYYNIVYISSFAQNASILSGFSVNVTLVSAQLHTKQRCRPCSDIICGRPPSRLLDYPNPWAFELEICTPITPVLSNVHNNKTITKVVFWGIFRNLRRTFTTVLTTLLLSPLELKSTGYGKHWRATPVTLLARSAT